METDQRAQPATNNLFYKRLKGLSGGSSDDHVLETIDLLKNKKGIAEITRRSGRDHVPIMDSYYRHGDMREFVGAVILRRDATDSDISAFTPKLSPFKNKHQRRIDRSQNTVAGDILYSALDPKSIKVERKNQVHAIARDALILPKPHQELLQECDELRRNVQESCARLFYHARGANRWRYFPSFFSQLKTYERDVLSGNIREIQKSFRDADHLFASIQRALYGIELGSNDRSPDHENVSQAFRNIEQILCGIQESINNVAFWKVKI